VVHNSSANQVFMLDIPEEPEGVALDLDNWVLSSKNHIDFTMASISDPIDTAYLGEEFYKQFQAVGGTPPYIWEHISGQFPYGLTLDTNGSEIVLSGIPTYASVFNFKMRVLDSDDPANADTANFKIVVVEDYLPGDVNNDDRVNVSDAVFIINYAFNGGPPPLPLESGDVNCDGRVSVADAVYIINYVFAGGPPPQDCD
jgi:hypothetical protein